MTGIRDVSAGRNIQLVPFAFFRDFKIETDSADGKEIEDDNEESVGLDAKIVLNDALVLDLTANPDFSQVESDQPQVTVNERFELFFPELRPFFLENADLFRSPTNLFFSRRIVDPSAGAKLTGKWGNWTIASLFADDAAPGKEAGPGDPLEDEHAMNGVVRVSRDISAQSKLGVMLTDRELADGYNRVGAVDGRFKLNDNWVAEFQVAGSGTRDLADDGSYETTDGMSYNAVLSSTGTNLSTHTHYLYTSSGFRTLLGFLRGNIQRPDTQNLHHSTSYRVRPTESQMTEWGPNFAFARTLDTSGNGLDWSVEPEFVWRWVGNTTFEIGYEHSEVRLLPEEFPALPQPQDYSQNEWEIEFDTRRFTRVGFGAEIGAGTRIIFVPPEGLGPELADFVRARGNVLWRPIPPLRLDFSFFRTRLDNRDGLGGGSSPTPSDACEPTGSSHASCRCA